MKLSKISRLVARLKATSAGFTMIELLIVIAILGILAVAVLSAINPVEQINRGRDTGSQSDAEQLISAVNRFNAFKGYQPWVSRPGDDTTLVLSDTEVRETGDNTWFVTDDGAVTDCPVLTRLGVGDEALTNCAGAQEVQQAFVNRVDADDYNPLYIANDGSTGGSTYVCFAPQSQAFLTDAIDRCNEVEGALPPDFPDGVCDPDGDEDYTDSLYCIP